MLWIVTFPFQTIRYPIKWSIPRLTVKSNGLALFLCQKKQCKLKYYLRNCFTLNLEVIPIELLIKLVNQTG